MSIVKWNETLPMLLQLVTPQGALLFAISHTTPEGKPLNREGDESRISRSLGANHY